MGAANNSFIANYILGMCNLVFPDYAIERWHSVLLAYLAALIGGAINIFVPHLLRRLTRAVFIWNLVSFVVIVIVLLATNDHKQDASFVFVDFQNNTGLGSAMATIVGILQALFGMCCYDTPVHMIEEMTHASRDAPRAVILSVVIGAVTGFIFLVTLCFCIGDIASTANTSTGSPVLQIFYDSTGSKVGACFMVSMIVVIMFVSTISLVADGSRSLYAFARDQGLPFSGTLSKVDRKKHIPIYAIVVTVVVQMAFNSIYFGTVTGFNTVVSIATTGFCKYPSPSLIISTQIPTTLNRRIIRPCPPSPLTRPFLPRTTRLLRRLLPLPSHFAIYKPNRLPIPAVCIHLIQFPLRSTHQRRNDELYQCRDWGDWVVKSCDLVYDGA